MTERMTARLLSSQSHSGYAGVRERSPQNHSSHQHLNSSSFYLVAKEQLAIASGHGTNPATGPLEPHRSDNDAPAAAANRLHDRRGTIRGSHTRFPPVLDALIPPALHRAQVDDHHAVFGQIENRPQRLLQSM